MTSEESSKIEKRIRSLQKKLIVAQIRNECNRESIRVFNHFCDKLIESKIITKDQMLNAIPSRSDTKHEVIMRENNAKVMRKYKIKYNQI